MQGILENIDTIIYREKCKKGDLSYPYNGINFQWKHRNDLIKILDEKYKSCTENTSLRFAIHITKEKNKYMISCVETSSKWGFINHSDKVDLPDWEIYESEILKNFNYRGEMNISMSFMDHNKNPVNIVKRLNQKINYIIDVVSNLS